MYLFSGEHRFSLAWKHCGGKKKKNHFFLVPKQRGHSIRQNIPEEYTFFDKIWLSSSLPFCSYHRVSWAASPPRLRNWARLNICLCFLGQAVFKTSSPVQALPRITQGRGGVELRGWRTRTWMRTTRVLPWARAMLCPLPCCSLGLTQAPSPRASLLCQLPPSSHFGRVQTAHAAHHAQEEKILLWPRCWADLRMSTLKLSSCCRPLGPF